MKFSLFFISLLLFSNGFSQEFKLNFLTTLLTKSSIDKIDDYLSNVHDIRYVDQLASDIPGRKIETWGYEYSSYSEKAAAWIYLVYDNQKLSRIDYSVFNDKSYNTFFNSITNSGFKYLRSGTNDDGDEFDEYQNSQCILTLTKTVDFEQNYTIKNSYSIVLIFKNGPFDFQNGKKQFYHENGKIMVEFWLKDGEMNGPRKEFDDLGYLISEVNFKNDLKEGVEKLYFNNRITEENTYKNDTLNGPYKWYHLSGALKETGYFVKNQLNGKNTIYSEDGEILTEFNYTSNILNGPFKDYYFDSLTDQYLFVYGTYKNSEIEGKLSKINLSGDTMSIYNYRNDMKNGYFKENIIPYLKREGHFKNNYLDGIIKYYIPFGRYQERLWIESNYQDGLKNGSTITHFYPIYDTNFEDSIIEFIPQREVENYIDGILNGDYILYQDGRTRKIGQYKDGEQAGMWTEVTTGEFREGEENLVLKGDYISGEKQGPWRGFLNDTLYFLGDFKNDIPNGEWKFYDNQGNVDLIKRYEMGNLMEMRFYYASIHQRTLKVEEVNAIKTKLKLDVDYLLYQKSITFEIPVEFNLRRNIWEQFVLHTNYDYLTPFDQLNYKNGPFIVIDSETILSGNYAKDKKSGEWKEDYLEQPGYCLFIWNDQNNKRLDEHFYFDDGNPYFGVITVSRPFYMEKVNIKNGLRHGLTEYLNDQNEVIYKAKYKKGILIKEEGEYQIR